MQEEQGCATRAEWNEIYRQMRMRRGSAMRWLYRSARVRKGVVVSERYLAHLLLTVVDASEDDAAKELIAEFGPMMLLTRMGEGFDDRRVYALHIRHQVYPGSETLQWALATLALYVLGALQSFGSAGRLLELLVADAIRAKWISGAGDERVARWRAWDRERRLEARRTTVNAPAQVAA